MSDVTMEDQAQRVSARVSPSVGFDPATIFVIISTVLPLIIKCFSKNDEPDPAKVNAAVKKQHASNPVALRRRTARRIRGEAEQPMSKLQSFDLADAVIAEACESDPETVAAVCRMTTEPGELG